MNKKILISSIIAVTILIGVSFTSVVGYRRLTSDVKASPLFNIRSSRAIDEESRDLSCEYVGKGENNTIPITTRNAKNALVQKVIDEIFKIDENKFNRFIRLALSYMERNNKIQGIDSNELFILPNLLSKNIDGTTIQYFEDFKKTDPPTAKEDCPFPSLNPWIPRCFLILSLLFVWFAVLPMITLGLCTMLQPPC